jgi:hypothetical protein
VLVVEVDVGMVPVRGDEASSQRRMRRPCSAPRLSTEGADGDLLARERGPMMKPRRCMALIALALGATGCAGVVWDVKSLYKSGSPPDIVTERDEMTGRTWIKPALASKPGAGFYFYFGTEKDGTKGPMRAVFEMWRQDWVFSERVLIKADERLFEVAIPRHQWDDRVIPGGAHMPTFCAERADVPLGITNPEIVTTMCAAATLRVRFVGRDREHTLDENSVFVAAIKGVCQAYYGVDFSTAGAAR